MSFSDVPDVHAPGFRDTGTIRFIPDSDTVLARMDRSTVEVFTSLDDYVDAYGPYVDRLGYPTGKYFWHIPSIVRVRSITSRSEPKTFSRSAIRYMSMRSRACRRASRSERASTCPSSICLAVLARFNFLREIRP